MDKLLFNFLGALLLILLFQLIPKPHHHFTKKVVRNRNFKTTITLCTFYEDTMQVMWSGKHIPYDGSGSK